MTLWKDYKAAARARGALAFELYAVISTPAVPDLVKETLSDHLSYQASLEQQGSLAFAGPMSDETGEHMQGMGLIIYRAADFEHAVALAEADPMHANGARKYSLRRWMINEGNLSLSVQLSQQSVELK